MNRLTAQHSTAQHSTAQHSTAQHSSPPLRDSNIEMLRIISMLMITLSHLGHRDFSWGISNLSASHLWIAMLSLFGKIGVNIFVLITGYYLIASKDYSINLKKILKYLGQIYFYSVGIFLVFALYSCFSRSSLAWRYPVLFPILTNLWWFASIYFWLFLIHGFLNRLLQNLVKNDYQKLIVLLLICFSLIPSIMRKSYHSELLWFVILYTIAGYIRRFGVLFPLKNRCGTFYFMSGILVFLMGVLLLISGIAMEAKWPTYASHISTLGDMHHVFTLLVALLIFTAFVLFQWKGNHWINLIASATFGVYLIHDHPAVRHFLWRQLFANHLHQNSAMLIPYSIMAVLCVYVICTVIDLLRRILVERPFMAAIQKISPSLKHTLDQIDSRIRLVIFGK